MEPEPSNPIKNENNSATGSKSSSGTSDSADKVKSVGTAQARPTVEKPPPGAKPIDKKAQAGAIYGTGSGSDALRYRKIKGPKKKRFKLPTITLASILRIETLLVLAGLVAAFVIASNITERGTRDYIVRDTTLGLATALRDAAYTARESHKFMELRAEPGSLNSPSFYKVIESGDKFEIKTMPPGLTITGDVTFDPYGCPNRATKFTVRKGSSTLSIEINNRGKVTVPEY